MSSDVARPGPPSACPLCGDGTQSQSVRWRRAETDLVQCRTCGLLWRHPRVEVDDAAFAPSRTGLAGAIGGLLENDPTRVESVRHRLRWLETVTGRGTLLDVGAGDGLFVREARALGWDAHGIDTRAALVARARAENRVPVEEASLAGAASGRFDVVTMWHWLERAADPRAELAAAFAALSPGGFLSVLAYDCRSPAARAAGSRWSPLADRGMLSFFSAATLERAVSEAGFRTDLSWHPLDRFPVIEVLDRARGRLPAAVPLERVRRRVAGTRLGRAALPLGTGDSVSLVARKPPRL